MSEYTSFAKDWWQMKLTEFVANEREVIWWMDKLGAKLIPIRNENVNIPGHSLLFSLQTSDKITKALFVKSDGWLGKLINENLQLKLSNMNLHQNYFRNSQQGVLKGVSVQKFYSSHEIEKKNMEIEELKANIARCLSQVSQKDEELEESKLENPSLKDEIDAFEKAIATYHEEFTKLRSSLCKAEQKEIEINSRGLPDVSLKDAVDEFEKAIAHCEELTELRPSSCKAEQEEQIEICSHGVLDVPVKTCLPYTIKSIHNVLANTCPGASYSFLTEEFYTGTPGYKLQFRVSLCQTFFRLDFRVKKGMFDEHVRWPLSAQFEVMVNSDVLDLTERTLLDTIDTSVLDTIYVERPFHEIGNAVYKKKNSIDLTKYISYRSDLLFDISVKTTKL